VRGVGRKKKLNRNPPTPIPHHRRGPHYPSPTPLPSPDARNCIHPIEFLYRGKRTKRELRAYYSIWYIMFMCVCVCTMYKVSPHWQTGERGIDEGSGSRIVYRARKFQKSPPEPLMSFIRATHYYRQVNCVRLYALCKYYYALPL